MLHWSGQSAAWSLVHAGPGAILLETFLFSTAIVALAEIGDKTQLLAFVLAAKFRQPLVVCLGILVATLLNHFLAGAVGAWVNNVLGPDWMRWILAVSFFAMAIWLMIPDKIDDDDAKYAKYGAFLSTVIVFFIAEMGDKTQVATVMLAAQYESLFWVVMGTTAGMMLANAPVVFFGDKINRFVSIKVVHAVAAVLFAGMGVLILLGVGV